jgi:calcium-dependent protein kinase
MLPAMVVPEMKNVSIQLKDLIAKILVEPHKRPTAAQILEHPWLNTKTSTEPLKLNYSTMKRFCTYSKFRKIAVTLIATQLQEKDILELGKVFKQIDKNGDGTISLDELKQALETRKEKADLTELKTIMESLDSDKSGTINYTEFIASCLEQSVLYRNSNILAGFRLLDTDGDGKVTREELKQLLERTR